MPGPRRLGLGFGDAWGAAEVGLRARLGLGLGIGVGVMVDEGDRRRKRTPVRVSDGRAVVFRSRRNIPPTLSIKRPRRLGLGLGFGSRDGQREREKASHWRDAAGEGDGGGVRGLNYI